MSEPHVNQTQTSGMALKSRREIETLKRSNKVQLAEDAPKTHAGSELLKNLSMSAAIVMCVVALRSGAVPGLQNGVDAVLTAASGDTLLDDQLGRLSFVSSIFPEATLVFGESSASVLAMPVMSGSIVHTWSRQEPYTTWETRDHQVFAAMDGEVSGVYHGNGDEVLVAVSGAGGLSSVYGNLAEATVKTGDTVRSGEMIGTLMPDAHMAFEVRQDGISVDPVKLLPSAQ